MLDFDKEKHEKFVDSLISFNNTDEELTSKLDSLQSESKSFYNINKNKWRINNEYFRGTKKIKINGREIERITNPIWPRIRSMVGIETDQLPKAVVRPPLYLAYNSGTGEVDKEKRDDLNKNAKNLEKWFVEKLQELKWQSKATTLYFQKHKYNDAFLMPYWDFENNDFDFEVINPKDIMIDQNAMSLREAEWIKINRRKNRKYMVEHFGVEIASQLKYEEIEYDREEQTTDDESAKTSSNLQIWLFDRFVIYRSDTKILKKIINPFYNFDSDGEQYRKFLSIKTDEKSKGYLSMFDKAKDKEGNYNDDEVNEYYNRLKDEGLVDSEFTNLKNYFKYPRKALIQFRSYDDGESLYSYPGFEQLTPIADDIEDTKQQIMAYRQTAADPTVLYNSSEITEEDAKKALRRRSGEGIGIPVTDGNLRDNLIFDNGAEMPVSVLNNMRDSEAKLDETAGNNDVSRGRADPSNETAEGIRRIQLADQTPIRILTRFDEDAMQEVFEWCLQFIALFYNKEDHFISQEDDEMGEYQMPITNDILTEGIKVFTRTGSTMPIDKDTQRERARTDAKLRLISPETYFEIAEEYGDPKEQAYRTQNWNNGIVSDENLAEGQGGESKFSDDPNVEMAIAQNKEIMLGRNIDIVQGEDSRVHYDIHLQAFKEIEAMPEGPEKEAAKASATEHLKETVDKLASEGIDVEMIEPGQPANQPANPSPNAV